MKKSAWSILAIHVAGGSITALLLGWGVWIAFLRPSDGGESTRELTTVMAGVRNDLTALGVALDTQMALELGYRSELASVGPMPVQAPPETYLRMLSTLAAENHLGVVRQLPLSAREYPGLLEQRFAYEVIGSMPDLARFFKAVESSPSWTDISYLKIDQGKGAVTTNQRNAFLTFSVFSMAKNQPVPRSQGASLPGRGG